MFGDHLVSLFSPSTRRDLFPSNVPFYYYPWLVLWRTLYLRCANIKIDVKCTKVLRRKAKIKFLINGFVVLASTCKPSRTIRMGVFCFVSSPFLERSKVVFL